MRFTIRRLMLAVAAVAVALGGVQWSLELASRSAEYRKKAVEAEVLERRISSDPDDSPEIAESRTRSRRLFASVKGKYRRAARYPWLPLPSIPADPVVWADHGPQTSAFAPRPK